MATILKAEEPNQQAADIGMAAKKAAGLWRDRENLDNEMTHIRAEFDRYPSLSQ